MKYVFVGLLIISFLLGGLTTTALEQQQIPNPLTGATTAPERAGPQNWIEQKDIHVLQDHVRINIRGAKWASFAPTGSMRPVLDAGAHAIQIQPTSTEQIHIGDIITYDHNGRKIIHRVVDIQQDAQGVYYTVKGDNNNTPDPVKVRFEDVERVVVAIIY